ncbi:glycoside hydrolase family 3 C-terminal domain-containing protein [Mucilaginibacter sp. BJC16-A38]|uniref:glycoside hydrolase family 3 N-terminal domain-containing protein n=1 Tax=Mucilaginibacter phenanthrenivorans TaxID=1234842 RepID=UPI00215745DE|nr:glycoside hydrolase family 3 N-terminal domain-containing protein [Mucilaginibacter phenanthrenivorans]MCR8559529.1 glycoside hydrolase family 3 C-terminal domain-containing protein [Mucilaginibacter phenanthrenivorans]
MTQNLKIPKITIGKAGLFFLVSLFSLTCQYSKAQQLPVFRDASKPLDTRVADLISKLTLEEKISLLGYRSKAVPRLNIPAYNWWNESLHGVARAGEATIFPQAIAMAATFDDNLVKQVSTVISTEARAKYNLAYAKGQHQQYMGLTFWSPNINIFRDPRWGRGQETYGEDPYLTARTGTAYIQGMQGNDPLHLKVSATAKHFAVHSGPESERDKFNAIVDEKDLRETYLYAFHALVNGGVESVMSAYNRINGMPNSINKTLLTDILRKEWGFKGHVVTDCGALDDVFLTHKTLPNSTETAAAAIKAGIDLDCSSILQDDILKAINQKLLTEREVDQALAALLRTQIKLGFFDEQSASPYKNFGDDSIHNAAHVALTRKVAQQSMVLLKNDKNILPLKKSDYPSIMVLGPNAASLDALVANYHGVSSKAVNFVEGITAAVDKATRVEYDLGASHTDTTHFGGTWAAGNADLTIAVIGLSPVLEGEAGDAFLSPSGGDKKDLSLPPGDIAFMKELRKSVKKPIIAVVTAGSDVDISAIESYADAIILAWYPGEQGGNALADLVFGAVSPSGHLPVTFYKSIKDVPAFGNYNMQGRTYRYFDGPVQYPFGFGLSYTSFNYQWQQQPQQKYTAKDSIKISVQVENTGSMDGDEVVQAYIQYPQIDRMPLKELKDFKRVNVKKGDKQSALISIPVSDLQKWDLEKHKWQLYPGKYQLYLGSNSTDKKLSAEFLVK